MNIHQVSVNYFSDQDRMLLRISTQTGEELRVWFTRRLMLGLLPALSTKATEQVNQLAGYSLNTELFHDKRQTMLEKFQKESAIYGGDYKTPFQVAAGNLPLGVEPLLVNEINLTLLAEGQLQVQMIEKLPTQTRNLQIVMDAPLVQSLLQLFNQTLPQTQWLEMSSATGFGVTEKVEDFRLSGGNDKPKYLN